MKVWEFINTQYLLEGSDNSSNTGQYPIQARYLKRFANIFTGELIEVTDLHCKKIKRDVSLNLFIGKYGSLYAKKEISILSTYVDASKYKSIATFNNSFCKKLKRKGIKRLGYVWIRDIGDIKFEKHFHVLIATTRISADMFRSLFHSKKDSKYNVEFMKTKYGMKRYIQKKELYAAANQRSYGKSRRFFSHK